MEGVVKAKVEGCRRNALDRHPSCFANAYRDYGNYAWSGVFCDGET